MGWVERDQGGGEREEADSGMAWRRKLTSRAGLRTLIVDNNSALADRSSPLALASLHLSLGIFKDWVLLTVSSLTYLSSLAGLELAFIDQAGLQLRDLPISVGIQSVHHNVWLKMQVLKCCSRG